MPPRRVQLRILLGAVLILLPHVVAGQDGGTTTSERTLAIAEERIAVDTGPLDHLGWGTPEDLFVDLGAGAAVSVFSGNLVLHAPLFLRGDAVADSQLALTYNHLDDDGAPELGPGWTYDLGRTVAPGPWGDRVLVDADGFRDAFFAGEPPTEEEARGLVGDLVRAWRKATPRRERAAAGGDGALRAALASDPLFFGEMRARLLGPPPEPVVGEDRVFRSSQRGQRTLVRQDDGKEVLARSDGGTETYGTDGRLVSVEPTGSQPIELLREGEGLQAVKVGGSERYTVFHDSWGRIDAVRSNLGQDAALQWAGRSLLRLESPAGPWRFGYDDVGRLSGIDSPVGLVQVEYNAESGRVRGASGPLGAVRLGDVRRDDAGASVDAVIGGQVLLCSWDSRTRVRRVEAGSHAGSVRFEEGRPLPVEVVSGQGTFSFEWDGQGRLLRATRGDVETRWERSADGRLLGIVGPGGERLAVAWGEGGMSGWIDPAGRRTGLQFGPEGLPRTIDRPGGLTETAWRGSNGLLRSVSATEGESLDIHRDARGFVRAVESIVSGTAGLLADPAGRLVRIDSPAGLVVQFDRAPSGVLRGFDDARGGATLEAGTDGLLAGWRAGPGRATVARDALGLPSGLDMGARGSWTIERSAGGLPSGLAWTGRPPVRLLWSPGGLPEGSSEEGGFEARLLRDARGRIVGLDGPEGGISIEVDDAGRAVAVGRGTGRWRIDRDDSGRATGVADRADAATSIQLDPAGRPLAISSPQAVRWRLTHDGLGHLVELGGAETSFVLRYDRAGRPLRFAAPQDREVELLWDRAGRWRSVQRRGEAAIEAGYGAWGPSSVGAVRWALGPDGSIEGWGPEQQDAIWRIERDAAGMAAAVRWLQGPAGGNRQGRQRAEHALGRDSAGRCVEAGGFSLRWTGDRIEELAISSGPTWRIERGPGGRPRTLRDEEGRSAEVDLDPSGDARRLSLGDGQTDAMAWEVDRDPAGRIVGLRGGSGGVLALFRDLLGRTWRGEADGGRWSVDFEPMDGSSASGDGLLAEALGVEVDRAPAPGGHPSGSRRLTLSAGDGTVLSLDEVRDPAGALASVGGSSGVGEVAGTALPGGAAPDWSPAPPGGAGPVPLGGVLDESPIRPGGTDPPWDGATLGESPIDGGETAGSPSIADALLQRSRALPWAAAPLSTVRGEMFVPSPDGRGVAADARSGWSRLAGEGGGTLTWVPPDGRPRALRLPAQGGRWTTPAGWLPYPSPPGAVDPVVAGLPNPPPLPGDPSGVERWWAGMEPDRDALARLPPGMAVDPRAWQQPRISTMAEDALLPATSAPTGAGSLVPPVPGSARLVPGLPGVLRTAPLTALVLAGDLPPEADAHLAWLSLPPPAWQVEVPGAAMLHDLAVRRFQPAVPPGWRAEDVAGLAPGLAGVLLSAGRARAEDPPWDFALAVSGLPAGTADLVPGVCAQSPGAAATLPSEGRCSAWDGLADDPWVPGARRREAVAADSMLLLTSAQQPRMPGPLSGWLDVPRVREAWALDLPSGVRVVADERGRPLSVDLQSRLVAAWGGRAASLAGRAVLHPEIDPAAALSGPAWLPEPSDLPESTWGLAPADPRFPLTSLAQPALPLLRALAGLPPADRADEWPPMLP